MGFSILIESFIVTVIGGMGSIVGAFDRPRSSSASSAPSDQHRFPAVRRRG
jgi:hypothetical protein